MSGETMLHVDHPDDERFDRVTIECEERWKESELSGDEWRFSYVVKLWRKDEAIITASYSRLSWALQRLPLLAGNYPADKVFDKDAWKRTGSLCDQPGCSADATVYYRRLKRYTDRGDLLAPNSSYDGREYRQFCERHKHRGDCALDDADHNYERITIADVRSEVQS